MKNDTAYLKHILEAIDKIESYLSDATFESFPKNNMMVDAVVRELEIIGEATGNLSDELQNQYPDVPWDKIKGMRNVLIHEYFQVDLKIVWEACKKNLPELKRFVAEILG